jgi:hypothetical protein
MLFIIGCTSRETAANQITNARTTINETASTFSCTATHAET